MEIQKLKPEDAGEALEDLIEVLLDCVNRGSGVSISFYPPLDPARARQFWLDKFEDVARGKRILLVARESEISRVVGTVMVEFPGVDNQPHRGDVQKMLVHGDFRRRGIGTALMKALEIASLEAGRTLLVLDTLKEGDAEDLYQQLGWQRVGEIPYFVRGPQGQYASTVFFYKNLLGE
jgi:ribosomal protein S18 acetylase RimI-like enzyme